MYWSVIGPQLARGFTTGEPVKRTDDHRMGHGHDGPLLPPTGCQPLGQGGRIRALGPGEGKSKGTNMLKTASVLNRLDNGTSKWISVGSICVLGLVMRLACTTGLIASDDGGYSHYARLIAQDLYVPELHHYAIRYGLTIPVAGVY
jgi:hypothetical protein